MFDLHLAFAHHLIAFALLGVIVAELALLHTPMSGPTLLMTARIDLFYGLLAGLILAVGFARAFFAAKGWDYYAQNMFFWAKIASFAAIGLLSLTPTLRFLRWRRLHRDEGRLPGQGEITGIRRFIWIELALFALLPLFAAAMARGYGALAG